MLNFKFKSRMELYFGIYNFISKLLVTLVYTVIAYLRIECIDVSITVIGPNGIVKQVGLTMNKKCFKLQL